VTNHLFDTVPDRQLFLPASIQLTTNFTCLVRSLESIHMIKKVLVE
jgi:hypothetical protein